MNSTVRIIPHRILSLDVFRGLIIALMIVVNSQGNGSYSMLLHAEWNGWTLADLVFPGFLFIVGLSLVISLNKHSSLTNKTSLYRTIVQRSLILFLLGLFLNAFPTHFDWSLRIYGVLQRIAICYLIGAFIYLKTDVKTQIMIFLILLAGYWYLMTQVAVPQYGVNQLTPEGSWVAYIDQCIFSARHLLDKVYDPEGLLSTIPAIASTLSGVLIGSLLLSTKPDRAKAGFMLFYGILFLGAGWLWDSSFPINKNLWTSSFVLWTSGCVLIMFAFCFIVTDLLKYSSWAFPLKVFGMNALFAFMAHVILLKTQFNIHISETNLKQHLINQLFDSFSIANANMFYALFFLLVNFLLVFALYHHKIFLRI